MRRLTIVLALHRLAACNAVRTDRNGHHQPEQIGEIFTISAPAMMTACSMAC